MSTRQRFYGIAFIMHSYLHILCRYFFFFRPSPIKYASFLNRSIWFIDEALIGITNRGQSRSRSYGTLHLLELQIWSFTRTPPFWKRVCPLNWGFSQRIVWLTGKATTNSNLNRWTTSYRFINLNQQVNSARTKKADYVGEDVLLWVDERKSSASIILETIFQEKQIAGGILDYRLKSKLAIIKAIDKFRVCLYQGWQIRISRSFLILDILVSWLGFFWSKLMYHVPMLTVKVLKKISNYLRRWLGLQT